MGRQQQIGFADNSFNASNMRECLLCNMSVLFFIVSQIMQRRKASFE